MVRVNKIGKSYGLKCELCEFPLSTRFFWAMRCEVEGQWQRGLQKRLYGEQEEMERPHVAPVGYSWLLVYGAVIVLLHHPCRLS